MRIKIALSLGFAVSSGIMRLRGSRSTTCQVIGPGLVPTSDVHCPTPRPLNVLGEFDHAMQTSSLAIFVVVNQQSDGNFQ